jgi:hypothetical protein
VSGDVVRQMVSGVRRHGSAEVGQRCCNMVGLHRKTGGGEARWAVTAG